MSRSVFVVFALTATLLGAQAQNFNRGRLPPLPPLPAAPPASQYLDHASNLLYYSQPPPPPPPAGPLDDLMTIIELARSLKPAREPPRARLNSEEVIQKLINALVAATVRGGDEALLANAL